MKTWARRGLVVIAAVALCEWVCAARAYRTLAGPDDWRQVAEHLEATDRLPLYVAEPWLGPRVRMELVQARGWDSVAPPDLHDVPRYRVLSVLADPHGPDLLDDSRGLPPAEVVARHSLGSLTVYDLRNPGAGERIGATNLLAGPGVRVRDAEGRCRGGKNVYTCKSGKVSLETLEVEFRPRRCMALRVRDDSRVVFEWTDVELGDRLRGHVGFADFNARLRSDAAVALELSVDGQPLHTSLWTDEQGWAAFEVATDPGVHTLEVAVATAVQGVWNDAGYDARPSHLPCIELRALRGGESQRGGG